VRSWRSASRCPPAARPSCGSSAARLFPNARPRKCWDWTIFAWKKGDRYGTLLVDLQAHCPVEVLPDREAATVVRGPRAHRGVKIISRDRAGAYAEAATRGAPRARQVADRYHMLVAPLRRAQRHPGSNVWELAGGGRRERRATCFLSARNGLPPSFTRT